MPALATFTISVDVLLCPALGLLSLLKFLLTLISLYLRREIAVAGDVVILVRTDCGIDCGGLTLLVDDDDDDDDDDNS
jgi:hypothetical protein